jgi:RND family efflux transporter MFP subunit
MFTAACNRESHASAGKAQLPVVKVVHPIQRDVTDYAEFTGRVEAVESVQVRARVHGHLIKALFRAGADVKKDDVLFEIDPRPYKAKLAHERARLQQAEAEVRRAEAEYARFAQIIKESAASRFEYDTALANRDKAVADVAAAKAAIEASQLDLEFCTIRSPIDGRASNYGVTVGNLVAADQTLLTSVVSTDPVYAYFAVDELTFLRVKEAAQQGTTHLRDQALAPVFLGLINEKGFPHEGTINFADNQLKPSTGTIRVRAAFPNADRMLMPGLFARVRVPLSAAHPALLVPDRAIATDQGQKILLLVNEKDEVATRPIKPGAMHDGLRAIESGLKPGERVIIEGQLSVRPGAVVSPTLLTAEELAARAAAAASPATNPSASIAK